MRVMVFFLLLVSTCVSAQVENLFRGQVNIYSASGSDLVFTASMLFYDPLGKYASSDCQVGDAVYISYEDACVRLEIDSILSNSGGSIIARLVSVDTIASVFGIGAILRETDVNEFPTFISGISSALLSCMQTKFAIMVDSLNAPPSDGNGIISALPLGDVSIVGAGDLSLENSAIDIAVSDSTRGVSVTDTIDALLPRPGVLFRNGSQRASIHLDDSGALTFNQQSNFPDESGDFIISNTGKVSLGDTLETSGLIRYSRTGKIFEVGDSISANHSVINLGSIPSGTASVLIGRAASGRLVTTSAPGGVNIYAFAKDSVALLATDTSVSVSRATGSTTITVPSGVKLFSASLKGSSALLSGGNYLVTVNTSETNVNTGISNIHAPHVQVINTAAQLAGGPSDAAPFTYDEGSSPQRQITSVGTGDITVKIVSLSDYSNWVLKLTF